MRSYKIFALHRPVGCDADGKRWGTDAEGRKAFCGVNGHPQWVAAEEPPCHCYSDIYKKWNGGGTFLFTLEEATQRVAKLHQETMEVSKHLLWG
ncbi:MAG: hypothetical protein HY559_03065 [Gammaproteobacteria bacterium]|nr:hypothetical protein [Gammaproteobacteria bacterium]